MHHPNLNALLALALLVTGAAPQDPETGLRPEPPPRDPQAFQRSLEERLQGAWQLVGVTYRNVPQTNSSIAGYMLVLPDYLSIEMHLMMRSQYEDVERPFFQSGTHRWRVTPQGTLETSSLIGNNNVNDAETWRLEPPGTKRTFQMVLNGASLVLERKGESRMTFRKLPRLPYPGRGLEFDSEERAKKKSEDEAASGGAPAGETRDGG